MCASHFFSVAWGSGKGKVEPSLWDPPLEDSLKKVLV